MSTDISAQPARSRRWRIGLAAVITGVVALALGTVLPAVGARPNEAHASASTQSVAPVLSCPSGTVLSGGRCRTPRTRTVLRPSSCPAGWTRVAGEYGGHQCQRRVTRRVNTGQTRQVYSHTTYRRVFIQTGTERRRTGTRQVWVPPRTTTEPLVPPIRVRSGTRQVWVPPRTTTEPVVPPIRVRSGTRRVWVPPRTTTEPVVPPIRVRTGSRRRCDYDPVTNRRYNCRRVPTYRWIRSRTVTIPGYYRRVPTYRWIRSRTVTIPGYYRSVPTYRWIRSRTVTIPGYYRSVPVYTVVPVGYWDSVPTIHYRTVPIYRTVVEWRTTGSLQGTCAAGWQQVGNQCQRTVLGDPSSTPAQRCPAGSVPRYSDSIGGSSPSLVSCRSSVPGDGDDDGDDQNDEDDNSDSRQTRDGRSRPLHHLAGESDERLAELGIHRCADGLLSYVPCSELPGRIWDNDPERCAHIPGTTFRPEHGGTCMTGSDVLNKCTQPGECQATTIRTYCPAIGELASTEIQEHTHPQRGAETYRVCVFDCANWGGLPRYVQTRINGSYDYACLPVDDGEDEAPDSTTTTTSTPGATTTTSTPSTTTTSEPGSTTTTSKPTDAPPTTTTVPGGPVPTTSTTTTWPPTPTTTTPGTSPPSTTSTTTPGATTSTTIPGGPNPLPRPDPGGNCKSVPPTHLAYAAGRNVAWRSNVRSAGGPSPQAHHPGGGRTLQTAPGRGWMRVIGSLDASEGRCEWVATEVRTTWRELLVWNGDDRRRMWADTDTAHLVRRWSSLSAAQQRVVRDWHRAGVNPARIACTVADARGSGASHSCGWRFRNSGAYEWAVEVCYRAFEHRDPSTPRNPGNPKNPDDGAFGWGGIGAASRPVYVGSGCTQVIAPGMDWIRSVSDYAKDRVTVTPQGGSQ